MLIYLFPLPMLFISCILQSLREKRVELVIFLFFAAFVILLSGLRWYSDTDYESYLALFESVPELSSFNLDSTKELYGEIGYLFVNSIIKTIGLPFLFVTMFAALISIGVKSYYIYRFCKYPVFALTLYLCLHFVTTEFSEIRWSIATSFILLGYLSVCHKNIMLSLFFFVLSVLFHYFSVIAVILIVALFIPDRRYLYLLFLFSLATAIFYKFVPFRLIFDLESNLYIIARLIRYVNDPSSNVGFFSLLKMTIYPAVFLYFHFLFGSQKIDLNDRAFYYLEKASLVLISIAMISSFLPIFFLRIAPLADFFSILALISILSLVKDYFLRTVLFILISISFGGWYVIALFKSLSVPIALGGLAEYDSWLYLF